MSYNVINQVISGSGNTQIIRLVMKDNGTTSQTQTGKTQIIKQIVQSGERGPKGDPGKDGAIHYTAGPGIAISDENRISVTGGQVAVWGAIDGDLADQTDLKNVLDASYLSNLTGSYSFGNYKLTKTSKNILSGTTSSSTINLPNATGYQTGLLKSDDFTTFSTVINKLSYSKLTTDSTLSKTTSGSGTNTGIQLGVASGGVDTTQLADGAATTAKIGDGAVTTAKIADGAVTSGKANLTSSVDTVGWRKIQLSSNVNLYLAEGDQAISMEGTTWRQTKYLDKPSDLDLSNTFFGGAGGLSSDHAINLCGFVERTNATVQMQTQNIFEGNVNTTAYWWAYIIEIIG